MTPLRAHAAFHSFTILHVDRTHLSSRLSSHLVVIIFAWLLVLSAAPRGQTPSSTIDIDVTGEHRMASGDTLDSARQLARIDAQRRAWRTAVTRLQSRADVRDLQLPPLQLEAFTAVLLEIEEQPARSAPAVTRGPVQVRMRGRFDASEVARRIALLRKDQDATYDLTEALMETRQLHQQLESETKLRTGLSSDKASALVRHQLTTIVTLEAKHLSARALAALARTEPSTVGGRVPSARDATGEQTRRGGASPSSPESPDAHAVMGDLLVDARRARNRGSRISKGAAGRRRLQLRTNEAGRSTTASGKIRRGDR